jgi:uncharacterized repeat protein (TIGR01451 family)
MKSLRLLFLLALGAMCWAPTPGRAQGTTPPPQLAQYQTAFQALPLNPGGRNNASITISAVDSAGYSYGLLRYKGDCSFAGQTIITSDTLQHQTVVKLNPAGQLVWQRPFLSPWEYCSFVIRLDRRTNIYIAGLYVDQLTVDGTTLQSGGGARDYYVVKLAPNGSLLWADNGGGDGWRFVQDAAVDESGNFYVTGDYWFQSRVGGQIYTPYNASWGLGNTFLLKYSTDGTRSWTQTGVNQDSTTFNRGNNLGTDSLGRVFLLIDYRGRFNWGSTAFVSLADTISNSLWMRLDPATGNMVRSFELQQAETTTMAIDAAGNSYLYGTMGRDMDFGGGHRLAVQGFASGFLTRYNPDGALQWVKQFVSTRYRSVPMRGLVQTHGIVADRHGKLYATGAFMGTMQVGTYTMDVDGTSLNGFIAALDQQTGDPLWALQSGGPTVKEFYDVAVNNRGDLLVNGYSQQDSVRLGSLLLNSDLSQQFSVRIIQNYNTIRGEVFVDTDRNAVHGATENGFPYGLVVETLPEHLPYVTRPDGTYDAYVDLGNHAVALPHPPAYYTVMPTGVTTPAAFTTYGNVAAGRSFALQPIPGQQDVQVILTLVSPARPGNLLNYQVQYRNTGTVPLATGSIVLSYDAQLQFQSASATPATNAAQLLSWNFTALQPNQTRRFNVVFRLPATAPLGSIVRSTATVSPIFGDQLPDDNVSTAERTVTGSYDPNDLQVNHLELSTTQVANGEWLEYTIRFQNHGTDTAFTVAVYDSLSADLLRLSTIQILAASHNCAWSVSPTGQLLFLFDDILLPSQTTNVIASDGFVRFRVQPNDALVSGDHIPNQARIVFDYNVPLATNTVRTAINGVTGLTGSAPSADPTLLVWPSPASGTLHVEVTRPETGTLTLTLVDALGRPVLTQPTTATAHTTARATLDLRGLAAGVYVLRGQGAGQPFTRRVVVR